MPRLWLPIHKPQNPYLVVKDEETGREMILILPSSSSYESASQQQEVEQAAKERAIEEMRAKGPKLVSKLSRQEIIEGLKDYRKRLEKAKGRSGTPRYIGGF